MSSRGFCRFPLPLTSSLYLFGLPLAHSLPISSSTSQILLFFILIWARMSRVGAPVWPVFPLIVSLRVPILRTDHHPVECAKLSTFKLARCVLSSTFHLPSLKNFLHVFISVVTKSVRVYSTLIFLTPLIRRLFHSQVSSSGRSFQTSTGSNATAFTRAIMTFS